MKRQYLVATVVALVLIAGCSAVPDLGGSSSDDGGPTVDGATSTGRGELSIAGPFVVERSVVG